ncbi:hypothetical protein QFC20_004637 [Naganishia adeliensis]|uniref:Uncharacterized protein n=1 Tax=Naganishia adeliensis TaxID=92952 RepID=A0ACC2VY58_9TREE|nr:hypothetical protein QFC20_004637 [Naganishia adeliensis]
MIYPLLPGVFLLPLLVRATPVDPAARLVSRPPACIDTKIWHTQTYNLVADIQDADKFVAHLDDTYMVSGQNVTMTDCQLFEGFDRALELFSVNPYCVLSFRFSKADMNFKARGSSIRDVASATHWLFTIATALPMSNHTVSHLNVKNPNGLVEVLASSATSPVFLVTRSSLSIVTQAIDGQVNAWQGFDVLKPDEAKTYTEDEIKKAPDDTYLIYQKSHGSLPVNAKAQECDYSRGPMITNGTFSTIWPYHFNLMGIPSNASNASGPSPSRGSVHHIIRILSA